MADYSKFTLQDKSKPLTAYTADGDFVTKTETTVEYIRVPATITQAQASEHQHSNVGAPRNLYWWCKPSSNGNSGGFDYGRSNGTGIGNYYKPSDGNSGGFDYGRSNGTGISNYYKPSDAGMYKQVDHNLKQERSVIRSDGWDKSNNLGKETQLKGFPLAKPTIVMDRATDQLKNATLVMLPTQGHLLPPMTSKGEVVLPSIDSNEAAKRYGGFSSTPLEAYVPAIDSREAAFKYRGQVL